MRYKKIASLFLTGTLLFFSTQMVFAQTFSDTDGILAQEAIVTLVSEGILSGYEDGTFRPDNAITRAEASAVIVKAMNPGTTNLREAPSSPFRDLTDYDWAKSQIDYAVAKGIISGYNETTFTPGNNITYYELSTILVNALDVPESEITGSWPDNYYNKATELGIFKKLGAISPARSATRGDVALMVHAVLDSLKTQGNIPLTEEQKTPKTITTSPGSSQTIVEGMDFTGEAVSLSLKQAVEIMQTTGTAAQSAEIKRQSDQNIARGYSEQVSDLAEALDLLPHVDLSTALTLQSSGATNTNMKLQRLRKDFANANIENNYQADMNAIESQTVAVYYGVLQAQQNVSVNADNLAVQETILTNVKKKYELGTVAKIDVQKAENSVLTAKNSLKEAQNALDKAKMNFNLLLGYPVMQKVNYTDTLKQIDPPSITLTKAIEQALANRNEIQATQFGYEAQDILVTNLRLTISTSSSTYATQRTTLLQLETAVKTVPKSIEADIRTKYADLQDKVSAIEASKSTVALAEDAFRIASLMYDSGLNTLTDVQEAQIRVFQANQGLAAAIADYDVAVYDFQHAIGVGTERISL